MAYRILAYDTNDNEMMLEHYERLTKDLFHNLRKAGDPTPLIEQLKQLVDDK
jgi:hypothetical protein